MRRASEHEVVAFSRLEILLTHFLRRRRQLLLVSSTGFSLTLYFSLVMRNSCLPKTKAACIAFWLKLRSLAEKAAHLLPLPSGLFRLRE
jgi:hypothetical protein